MTLELTFTIPKSLLTITLTLTTQAFGDHDTDIDYLAFGDHDVDIDYLGLW